MEKSISKQSNLNVGRSPKGKNLTTYGWAYSRISVQMAGLKITISTFMIYGKGTENWCPSFVLPNYSE